VRGCLIALYLLCHVLLGASTFAQGEYLIKGEDAFIFGASGTFADNSHGAGVFLGAVLNCEFDFSGHILVANSGTQTIRQYGALASVFLGRERERSRPFFALRLGIDHVSASYGGSYQVITPTISLILAHNDATELDFVPSISGSLHVYSGSFSPPPAVSYQAALAIRFRQRSGLVFFIEPGVGIVSERRQTASVVGYVSIGILPAIH
jgi:hypothetical protein